MTAFTRVSNSAGELARVRFSSSSENSARQFGSRPLRRMHLRSRRSIPFSMTLRITDESSRSELGVMMVFW
jgi:hypothetical protein